MSFLVKLIVNYIFFIFMFASLTQCMQKFYITRFNSSILLLLCSVASIFPIFFFVCTIGIFDFNMEAFQSFFWFCDLDTVLIFGLDGLSFLFVLLTLFIFPFCFFAVNFYYGLTSRIWFLLLLLLLEFILLAVFTAVNLFWFYVYFEATLLPMFLLIGYFGSRFRKIKAAYYLFFYTFIGSVFMLIGLFSIYVVLGTLSFYSLFQYDFNLILQKILWLLFFITFAVKVPMVPFHIWLPEAHVEAPTVGSIILAAILLKLGGYGLLKFSINLFSQASIYFSPLVHLLSICGVIFASLSTLRQIDVKRIIAYSSIAHMNMAIIGLFVDNTYGIFGAIYLMFGHGLISAAMFFSIGVIYDRYHTRLLFYYGGLATVMPLFAFYLLFFSFANIGFPGTFNFISEFNILLGLFSFSGILMLFIFFGFLLTVVYSIWLFNRIIFGTLKIVYLSRFSDINFFEFGAFFMLAVFVLVFGVSTDFVTTFISDWNIYCV